MSYINFEGFYPQTKNKIGKASHKSKTWVVQQLKANMVMVFELENKDTRTSGYEVRDQL